MFWEYILASMLQMVGPGNSQFSTVDIPHCNKKCQETPACDNKGDWRCSKPIYNKYKHQTLINKFKNKSPEELKPYAFKRYETYEEGLVRYVTIAKAIADVSYKATRNICINKCNTDDCKQNCKRKAYWRWDRKSLAYMMLVIAKNESGFRRDVHSGETGGDCRWEKDGRTVAPGTKGARRVPGTCKSVCLGQVHIGKNKIHKLEGTDLVGIDIESTKRCFDIVARTLTKSRNFCSARHPNHNDWARATFAAYGSGHSCRIPEKKTVIVDGRVIHQYGYLIDGEVVWSNIKPFGIKNKNPIEAGWTKKRSFQFWNHYNATRVLSSKIKQKLQHVDSIK